MKIWNQVDPEMLAAGQEVLSRIAEAGYEAYWVGGCVRDEIMGRPVHDMDIATSARPESVMGLFERTIPTGLKHGTVTVLIGKQAFEVTTFRKETDYLDHRHPSSVVFVEAVIEDLQRRDFTMNAMAMNLKGNLTDPFHGREDLETKVIRCVGEADQRFEEDALRMVRAVRFASVFGFRLALSTWRGMIHNRDKLSYIAIERIRTETEKIVAGPDPLRGLELLRRSRLLEYAKLPVDLSRIRVDHLLQIPLLPAEPIHLRLSQLAEGLGIPADEVLEVLKNWTFSNRDAGMAAALVNFDRDWQDKLVQSIVRVPEERNEFLRRGWVAQQLEYGQETAALWIQRAAILQDITKTSVDSSGKEEEVENLGKMILPLIQEWTDQIPVHHVRELAVTGTQVLEVTGRQGGPWLGAAMKQLLFSVAAGDVSNRTEDLFEEVKRMVSEDEA